LIACLRPLSAGCEDYTNACWNTALVPCNAADCADIRSYPQDEPIPTCDNEIDTPTYFTSYAADQWYRCYQVSDPNKPSCTSSYWTCANVKFYKAQPCNTANQCGTTTFTRCKASAGVQC
jgi:hypothetical protein